MRELLPEVTERNYAKDPLKKAEVEAILAHFEVAEVLNLRHAIAKERGWKEKPPAKAAFVAAVVEDNNLLRRPIVIHGKKAVVGGDEKSLRALK